jgi:hypothetical protein
VLLNDQLAKLIRFDLAILPGLVHVRGLTYRLLPSANSVIVMSSVMLWLGGSRSGFSSSGTRDMSSRKSDGCRGSCTSKSAVGRDES